MFLARDVNLYNNFLFCMYIHYKERKCVVYGVWYLKILPLYRIINCKANEYHFMLHVYTYIYKAFKIFIIIRFYVTHPYTHIQIYQIIWCYAKWDMENAKRKDVMLVSYFFKKKKQQFIKLRKRTVSLLFKDMEYIFGASKQ